MKHDSRNKFQSAVTWRVFHAKTCTSQIEQSIIAIMCQTYSVLSSPPSLPLFTIIIIVDAVIVIVYLLQCIADLHVKTTPYNGTGNWWSFSLHCQQCHLQQPMITVLDSEWLDFNAPPDTIYVILGADRTRQSMQPWNRRVFSSVKKQSTTKRQQNYKLNSYEQRDTDMTPWACA